MESMYDDTELEMIEECDTRYLILSLLEYADELCRQIIELRKEVNKLDRNIKISKEADMTGYQPPYIDLKSDIYRSFYDFTAYEKFKEEFERANF